MTDPQDEPQLDESIEDPYEDFKRDASIDAAVENGQDEANLDDEDVVSLADTLGGLMGQVSSMDLTGVGTLGGSLERAAQSPPTAPHEMGEQIEEIADDMLALMQRVRQIEKTQAEVLTVLQQMETGRQQTSHSIAREIDTLRRDMLGDRQHAASIGLFNEMIPLQARLQTSRDHLEPDEDARMLTQMDAVIETLSSALRRMGCEEFAPAVNAPFDPVCMECAGYLDEGRPGVVLEVVRNGYRMRETILRPVSVHLLSPTVAQETDLDE